MIPPTGSLGLAWAGESMLSLAGVALGGVAGAHKLC